MPFAQELEYKHFDKLDSTNDYLRSLNPIAPVTVVSADFQTKGRGQVGNVWHSDKGQNLLFSILLMPENLKATDAFVLSQAMALSIKKTLDEHLDDISVKWPNDIYCHGEKICGTLIENALMGKYVGRSVIGSGINVNQTTFPEGLVAPATSMRLHLHQAIPLQPLLHTIMHHFMTCYTLIQRGEYEPIRIEYHNNLYLKGVKSMFRDNHGQFSGHISHVLPDGHIVIIDEAGRERRYAFKEVQLSR